MSNPVIFTAGGTVQADGGIYLTRDADRELLQLCQQSRFAYVLTARQMGKSSLMIATANTLEEQDIRTAIIDLTQIGAQTTSAEEWYLGFLGILSEELGLEDQLADFWQSNQSLSLTQRFTQFLGKVVLSEIEAPIVVFVDEIDSTLSLDFTDDFFIAIRYFYTARAQNPAFNRLSFVLVGVATPSELISNQKRTPFNIGDRVDLTDFTFEEALPLAGGLGLPEAEAQQVMQWVLEWTGGHPYLTQRLCKEVRAETDRGQTTWAKADVESLTGQLFFGDRREQDNNLQFVRDMLTRRTPGDDVLGVLSTYRQIRRGRQAVVDEDQSVVKAHLKLSGVVKREDRQLTVRNSIYWHVFDPKWVREQWPETWWERLKPAMPLIAGLSAVAVTMGGLAWYANNQRLNAITAATEAETERDNAREAEDLAERRLTEADQSRQQAEAQEKLAEERRKEAESAKQQAEDQRQQAVLAQQAETEQRQRAETEEAEANKQAAIAREQTIIANTNLNVANVATARAEQEAFKAATQAINAEIQAEALTVENLMAADLTEQAMISAIKLGQKLSEIEQSITNQLNTASKDNFTDLTVRAAFPRATRDVSLQSSTRLKAVSVLQKIFYFNGYLQRNIIRGHKGEVISVSLSPDGQILATASRNHPVVKLWDISGREIQSLQGHTGDISCVSFSPQGNMLASAGYDGTVRLWNRNGQELKTIRIHPTGGARITSDLMSVEYEIVSSVSFAPDSHAFVTGSGDGTVGLWDISGRELFSLKAHSGWVSSVSFSPDGHTIASASSDGTVKLWDISGQELQTLQGHMDGINSVSFAPDGQTLASASDDGTVKLWDRNGRELHTLQGHSGTVSSVSFSPDGHTIASASSDGTVKLWNMSGQELQTLSVIIGLDWVYDLDWALNGDILVTSGGDNTVRLWDRSGRELKAIPAHDSGVSSVSFAPDGQTLATSSGDATNTVSLWNTSGHELKIFPYTVERWVSSVAFSPDGKTLATASADADDTVKIWDTSGQELQTLRGERGRPVNSVSFSPDGSTLAIASEDGTVKLWNTNGQELQTIQGHRGMGVNSVSFAPDGQTLASASDDGTVKLWDGSGQELQTLQGHTGGVNSVSFAPDGQTLASASDDGTVKLWDGSGRELQTLQGHTGGVNSVSFAPDGQTLASASDDGTVKLWDGSGRELQTLQGHTGGVNSVSFAPDGQTLASASDDGTVILWNFNLDDLMAKSCNWLRDYMTNPTTPAEERALCATELGLSTQSFNPLQALQATLRTIPTELHRTYTAIKDRASS